MRPVVIPSVLALVGLGAAVTAFVVFRPVAPPVPFLATQQARVRVVTLTDALVEPWALAFLPNGDMLITQRGGRLRLMHQGRLAPGYVDVVPPVDTRQQDGLTQLRVAGDHVRPQRRRDDDLDGHRAAWTSRSSTGRRRLLRRA